MKSLFDAYDDDEITVCGACAEAERAGKVAARDRTQTGRSRMTIAILAGLILLGVSANALAQDPDPDAITKSVSQCPAAQAAFAKLGSLQEPAEATDVGLGAVNSCSYIEKLRSEGGAYMSELHSCAARGHTGLDGEILRVQALMSMLPDTPKVCQQVDG